ncbi:hypothetical protein L3Q82_020805 [Scortum barcoo]|uniref:Uncharacterized protein n=1 Tax=Scortum barcoo TaxID=214431 RepID=A0ACB8V8K0_9TELE|nr:hypothetical protein L3Q82_020805 [Scortum barcoo]
MRISTSKSEAMVLDRKRVECPLQRPQSYAVGVPDRRGEEGAESKAMKLSIYRSIYVPTLTYGHELWVMTERTRSCGYKRLEMSFLHAGWLGAPLEIGEVFQACVPPGGGLGEEDPGHAGETMSLGWPGNASPRVPPEELEEVSGVREVWASLLRLLPPRPGPGPSG